eukprot:gb/GFBE01079636.1/.p1 GENE.gb/GFBE01079636.1/~~gb/GFBE01079636.1/.p1  ORF type:complete len:258 (+),score=46.45 gb/GFBE01079636.1/:1-774(+)
MIGAYLDQIQPGASDDEDDEQPDVEFAFAGASFPAGCQTLVICGPGAASAFALEGMSLQPLSLRFGPVDDSSGARFPPPPRTPSFYQVCGSDGDASASVVVALLETSVPAAYAVAWAEDLLKAVGGSVKVVILDRILRAEWCSCSQEQPEEPFLAGLWSSAWCAAGREQAVVPLPAPNLVEGLPAALLSQCEASRRPCLVALSLQDGAHLGEGCIRGFEALVPALKDLKVLSSNWQRPSYRDAVRKVVPPMSMSIYA